MVVGIYDRYLVTILPLALVLIAPQFATAPQLPRFRWAAAASLLLIGGFSLCAVHDYLSWNRTRWVAINTLEKQGIPSHRIAGGVEFDAWMHYSDDNPEWWKTAVPEYRIVFDAGEASVVQALSYTRWLPGDGIIYITHNDSLKSSPTP